MKFDFAGQQVFASTGGREWQAGNEWIIFLHGAGQNHLTWSQQVRTFAYDDYNILALDLPGHGASRGAPLSSPEAMALWVVGVMDKLDIAKAHLVNHSMGGLISLELASKYPNRVQSVVFIATALTIAVGEFLIHAANDNQAKAIDIMTSMGLSSFGHVHDNSVPGASLVGSGVQIMTGNPAAALPADLSACANYTNGLGAAVKITCPCMVVLAEFDRMVAPRFGKKLAAALSDSRLKILNDVGHMLPAEAPREINHLMREFYQEISK